MILHIVLGDAQVEHQVSFAGMVQARLSVCADNEREYSMRTTNISTEQVVRFNETLHTPVTSAGQVMQLKFTMSFIDKFGKEVEIGTGACACYGDDHGVAKTVDLKNLAGEKTAHVHLTFFFFKAPMQLAGDKEDPLKVEVPNRKEYEFLLKRKLISSRRGKTSQPSSFNESTEKLLDAEVVLNYPFLRDRKSGTTWLRSLTINRKWMKKCAPAEDSKSVPVTAATRKPYVSSVSQKASSEFPRETVKTPQTKAPKADTPKTRVTSFGVGFPRKAWTEDRTVDVSEMLHKQFMADVRKMEKVKENAAQAEARNALWKAKADKIKADQAAAIALEAQMANLLQKKEEEIQELQRKLADSEHRGNSLAMKVKRVTTDKSKQNTKVDSSKHEATTQEKTSKKTITKPSSRTKTANKKESGVTKIVCNIPTISPEKEKKPKDELPLHHDKLRNKTHTTRISGRRSEDKSNPQAISNKKKSVQSSSLNTSKLAKDKGFDDIFKAARESLETAFRVSDDVLHEYSNKPVNNLSQASVISEMLSSKVSMPLDANSESDSDSSADALSLTFSPNRPLSSLNPQDDSDKNLVSTFVPMDKLYNVSKSTDSAQKWPTVLSSKDMTESLMNNSFQRSPEKSSASVQMSAEFYDSDSDEDDDASQTLESMQRQIAQINQKITSFSKELDFDEEFV